MASFIVHLRVAEKLYNEIEKISEKDFLIGNIAPDCGEANADGVFFTPPVEVSHFYTKKSGNNPDSEEFYNEYLNNKELSKEYYSFYLGYYCHLLTDVCWDEFKNDLAKEYGNDINVLPTYTKSSNTNIWESIDIQFLRNEEPYRPYNVLKKQKMYINNFIDIFEKYAFFKKIVKVIDFYDSNGTYLDFNMPKLLKSQVDRFVENAVNRIINRIDHIWTGIPNSNMWKDVDMIYKDWAGDKIYNIETFNRKKYRLEMANNTFLQKKKEEFNYAKKLEEVYVHKPQMFGRCNNNTYSFSIYDRCDTTSLSDIINKLNKAEQYKMGVQSGRILKRIHNLNVLTKKDWEYIYNKRIDHVINMFDECEFSIENTDKVIAYINGNRGFLNGRPQCLLHGNYQIDNMVIDLQNNLIGITSLNECCYGDPWLDFMHIVKTVSVSPVFACGQIDGYFNKNIPTEFFKLMSLYIACNQLSEITWSLVYGKERHEEAVNNAYKVFKWNNYFYKSRPSWYKENICNA